MRPRSLGSRAVRCALVCALALAQAAGCGKDDASGSQPATPSRSHPTGGTSWTVMVYLLADNDLEPFGLQDLDEMMRVGSSKNFTLLVQADRAVGQAEGGVGGLPDWTGAKRLRVERGRLTELEDLGDQDMGDPAVLADFIGWAAKTAPADRYALVLWDHGGAWPAYGVDFGSNHDNLTLPELAQAFEAGMKAGGIRQFSLVGFDACLMATYETAATLSPYAEYLVASEEVEPGHGWDYSVLRIAAQDPSTSPVDLGTAVVSGFRAQAEEQGQSASITLSLVDLYQFELLQGAVESLANDLGSGALGSNARGIGTAREGSQKFGENPDPARSTNMIDLGQFVATLPSSSSGRAREVERQLDSSVLVSMHGAARPGATGLSIYFPPQPQYYDRRYDDVPRVGPWRTFIRSYFGLGTSLRKPAFTNPEHGGELTLGGDGSLTIAGTLAAGTYQNVTDVTLNYGTQSDGGTLLFLGDQPGSLDASGVASATWNTSVLILSQGGALDYGYLSLTQTDQGIIAATIPFLYTPASGAGQEIVVLVVAFDARTGNELARTFYAESNGAWGELVPEEGARVQTLVMELPSGASETDWTTLSDSAEFDPNRPIDLELRSLKSGTSVFLLLQATDFGGNSDYVVAGGQLP